MIVEMWMNREVVVIGPKESITTAASRMATKGIRRLPVIERRADDLILLGMVTSSDLFRAYPPHVNPFGLTAPEAYHSDIKVSDVMKRHPFTTAPNVPIEVAAQAMRDHKVGGLPVVEKEVLVGIITESDIFRAFVSMFEAPRGCLRITFNTAKGEDIFALMNRLATPRKVKVLSLISSRYHDAPVCVVRLAGGELDECLDDIWKSGHHVLNVIRTP